MKHDGCPEEMYPMDLTFPPSKADNLDDLIEFAEKSADVLNFPIGWFIHPIEGEDDPKQFDVIFLMPRKYGQTWGVYTTDFDPDRAEAWVLDFTKRAATEWFGWD